MAGRLVVSTLNNDTGVLNVQNGMTGIAKAWVNFTGSNGAVRGSFNISSVTRNSTGNYTANFTTAMPDTNYSIVGSTNRTGSATDSTGFGYYTQATGSVSFTTSGPVGTYVDVTTCSIAVFSS